MIHELTGNYDLARPLFAGLKNRTAIQAVIEGNSPGRIFVDNQEHPSAAFMWNPFRYSYLAGEPSNDSFTVSLRRLLAEELLPQAANSHDPTLVLYPYPESWGERVDLIIGDYGPIKLTRQTFVFNPVKSPYLGWQHRVLPGLQMRRVDERLLEQISPLAEAVQVLWRSPADFVAMGLGYCLLDGEQVVSTCFSAFAGGNQREIGIDTHPAYRRRGLATLTASALIDHCLQNDWIPGWECWTDNVPSVKLAEKLGFERHSGYPVYFIDLQPGAPT